MATRSAIVSGLGPNGVLAALELLRSGYHVTVIEKRPTYTRPIHLHLRASYLDDVRRLSPNLHAKLLAISTPIEENSRVRKEPISSRQEGWLSFFRRFFGKAPAELEPIVLHHDSAEECSIRSRLLAPPIRHVRLDSAERLFYSYLDELSARDYAPEPTPRVVIRRGFILDLEDHPSGRFRASIHGVKGGAPEDLGFPELVVLAEGGKSTTVRQLGLESVQFSYPKHFMSAHVDVPFGPRTHRIDTDAGAAEVSFWACGHGDASEGTWIVLEVPESLLSMSSEQAENYFVEGAMLLLGNHEELRETIRRSVQNGAVCTKAREDGMPFAGTFKFEQQCLRHPAAGHNVVVLGDAAGMGHHALSSGLEMGACDLAPLRRLVRELAQGKEPAGAVMRYAETVYRSRITLLSLGMCEYYPNLGVDPLDILHRAADVFGSPVQC